MILGNVWPQNMMSDPDSTPSAASPQGATPARRRRSRGGRGRGRGIRGPRPNPTGDAPANAAAPDTDADVEDNSPESAEDMAEPTLAPAQDAPHEVAGDAESIQQQDEER